MGDVLVRSGSITDGQITQLGVELRGLPSRTLDRDTVLAWMKDGHSFIPMVDGARAPALLLIEVGDAYFVRNDAKAEPTDSLPPLG